MEQSTNSIASDKLILLELIAIDELFAQSSLSVAMNGVANTGDVYKIHVGGNPNTPTKVTQQQPNQTIFTKVMQPKKVGCFNRVDTPHARKQPEINIKNNHPPGSKNLRLMNI